MTTTSYIYGHLAYYDTDAKVWRYADTDEVANEDRPCVRCGRMPTSEGHDACLGTLPGVKYACCGHGVRKGYVKYSRLFK